MSVKLIQGDDLEFKILVKISGQCYDLSSVTAATLKIPNNNGAGTLDLTLGSGLTIPSPVNGEIVVKIEDTQSGDICEGEINMELILDESGEIKTLQFPKSMTVTARLF